MCHKSGMQSAQIERFVEHGMPQKIVKTVKYTLRKRAAEHRKIEEAAARAAAAADQVSAVARPGRAASAEHTDEHDGAQKQADVVVAVAVAVAVAVNAAADTETDRVAPATTAAATTTKATTTAAAAAVAHKSHTGLAEHVKEEVVVDQSHSASEREQPVVADDAASASRLKIPKMCGRFRRVEQNGGAGRAAAGDLDAIAVGTQMTKRLTQRVGMAVERLQSSHIFTLLTKTTQPAHLIAMCILLFVLLTVWPNIIESTAEPTNTVTTAGDQSRSNNKHPLAVLAYLGAFATHFGSQIWMTFVSGLSLYFSLPRHTFGQCQQILFPKYFALNATLSIGMLIIYVKYFLKAWTVASCVQLLALALCAVIEVTVRLYLAPPMLRLMHEKYKIEGAIGSGKEVGSIVQGDLVQCPHYQRVHKTFRRIHMTVAMGNMAVLIATCLHLYFLAAKIQIS